MIYIGTPAAAAAALAAEAASLAADEAAEAALGTLGVWPVVVKAEFPPVEANTSYSPAIADTPPVRGSQGTQPPIRAGMTNTYRGRAANYRIPAATHPPKP